MESKTFMCNGNMIWLGDDGILRSVVVDEKKEGVLPPGNGHSGGIRELTNGKRLPILADLRTIKGFDRKTHNCSRFSFDNRAVSAMAVIVTSPQSRKMNVFFLGPKRPGYPVRPFTDEAEATVWLKKFL
ncbi:MAG: STAS/SEC14 domain-containing protein [Spirochaetales bacterium]|nr:STAS/SEC14 domain-containing protein [Spirochaetales bacterium]